MRAIARAASVALAAALALGCAPAGASAATSSGSRQEAAASEPARVLAVVEPGGSLPSAEGVAPLAAAEPLSELPEGSLYAVDLPAGADAEEAAAALRGEPGVVWAQPDYSYDPLPDAQDDPLALSTLSLLEAAGAPLFDDPALASSDAAARANQYYLYDAGVTAMWEDAGGVQGCAVAVIDAGALLAHEDLAGNALSEYAWDACEGEPFEPAERDATGHGTHVSAIVSAACGNGLGLAGASLDAPLVAVKVVDDESGKASTSSFVAAYEYLFSLVDSGAVPDLRVVNISMGGYGEGNDDRLLEGVIERARDEYGIATVCAGGNGKGGEPRTDACYPGDYEACLSVTALDAQGRDAAWSDYNAAKDISAPGTSVYSALSTGESSYGKKSGTSQAAPVVSGALSVMLACVPGATVDEAFEALTATARPIEGQDAERAAESGSAGALDAQAALAWLRENAALPFSDTPAREWYAATLRHALGLGIANGYPDGSFRPNDTLTREQAAAMLYNLLGQGAQAPAAPQADVDQDEWYAAAVNWCVAAGVMNGYDGGTFGVGNPLTREQAACAIGNAARADFSQADPAALEALADAGSVSGWAAQGVAWAVEEGVLNGSEQPDGSRLVLPLATAERIQFVAMLANASDAGIL